MDSRYEDTEPVDLDKEQSFLEDFLNSGVAETDNAETGSILDQFATSDENVGITEDDKKLFEKFVESVDRNSGSKSSGMMYGRAGLPTAASAIKSGISRIRNDNDSAKQLSDKISTIPSLTKPVVPAAPQVQPQAQPQAQVPAQPVAIGHPMGMQPAQTVMQQVTFGQPMAIQGAQPMMVPIAPAVVAAVDETKKKAAEEKKLKQLLDAIVEPPKATSSEASSSESVEQEHDENFVLLKELVSRIDAMYQNFQKEYNSVLTQHMSNALSNETDRLLAAKIADDNQKTAETANIKKVLETAPMPNTAAAPAL